MINYWYYTGDTTYNDVTTQALLHQAGDGADYMPINQTKTEGNDDQGFWGMAAMSAAETKFQDPPAGKPGWLALAQGVLNTQVARWDTTTCNGGFRWQIFTFNNGYNYKNSISNGCVFNLAARLALYTGNATYADWAIKTWDWMNGVGLMSPDYKVVDGTHNTDNCTQKDKSTWTYNAGIFLLGGAAMYNYVSAFPSTLLPQTNHLQTNGSPLWQERVAGLLNASMGFFNDAGIMYEPCESGKCNVDQRSFKAYFSRWLAATAELAPFTHDIIMEKLRTSATAAVSTCTAGSRGTQCGLRWNMANDGSFGVGEQMAVLEVVQSHLVDTVPGWVSAVKGTGTSRGDVNAGTGRTTSSLIDGSTVTTADRVGAGILTALVIVGVVGGSIIMILA